MFQLPRYAQQGEKEQETTEAAAAATTVAANIKSRCVGDNLIG